MRSNMPMLAALQKHHQDILLGMEEVRRLCEPAAPDLGRLALARLKLSRLSAARSRFVTEQIIPFLLKSADPALRAELGDMQRAFAEKRLRSSRHVSAWSTQAIAADWEGYKLASRAIRAMMIEQIDRERSLFVERLRHVINL